MTDAVVISLIAAAASTISAVLGFLNNAMANRNALHIIQTRDAMGELKEQTNHKMDALLKVTGESEKAKGVLQEKQRQEETR